MHSWSILAKYLYALKNIIYSILIDWSEQWYLLVLSCLQLCAHLYLCWSFCLVSIDKIEILKSYTILSHLFFIFFQFYLIHFCTLFVELLYYFPMLTVTNYQKLSGLIQQNQSFSVLECQGLKQFHQAKINTSTRVQSFQRFQGTQYLVFFQFLMTFNISWIVVTTVQSSNLSLVNFT